MLLEDEEELEDGHAQQVQRCSPGVGVGVVGGATGVAPGSQLLVIPFHW